MNAKRLHAELQQARREIATLRGFVDVAASYTIDGRSGLICRRPGPGQEVYSSSVSVVRDLSGRARQLQLQRV